MDVIIEKWGVNRDMFKPFRSHRFAQLIFWQRA